MSDNKRKLYDALSQDYDMGTFEQFSSDIENPEKRKKLYDATIEEYDFGDYDSFSEQLGFGKSQPKPSLEVAQDKPSVEQPVSVAPTMAVPTPKVENEVKQPNIAENQPISKIETPAAPKFGTEFKPPKKEYPNLIDPNITTFSQQKNTDQILKEQNRGQVAELASTIEQELNRRGEELDAEMAKNPIAYRAQGTAQTIPAFDANRTIDPEYRNYNAAKKALETAQNMIDAADANANGEGFVGGVARGFGEKFFDLNTFDMGMGDLSDNAALLKALDAYDKGELTPSQQALLDAKAVELATTAYFGSEVGRGYKAGMATAESIPLMLEMAINPAKAVGQGLTNRMARYALNKFSKKAARSAVKAAGRAIGDLAGASAMTATTGAVRTAADALDRMSGDIELGFGKAGEAFFKGHKEGDSIAKAVAKAFAGTTIENYSEMMSDYFAPIVGGVNAFGRKALDKIHLGKVTEFIDNVAATDIAKTIGQFEKYAEWHGGIGEFVEEVAGGALNAIIVGDQTLDNKEGTGVFNGENLADTAISTGLMAGFFSGIKTAAYPVYKYKANRAVDSARLDFKNAFKNDADMENLDIALSSGNLEQAKESLANVLNNGAYTTEQKEAATKYAQAVQRYNGAVIAANKRRAELQTPEQNEVETSFEQGYDLAEPQQMNDAQIELMEAEEALRRMYALAEDEDIDTFLGETPIESALASREMGASVEEQNAKLDYLNAKAKVEGMFQKVRDDIGAAVEQSNKIIDSRVNKDDSMIHPATLKNEDRKVYIVVGNVAMYDDGSAVDTAKSSKDIIVQDAETGKLEMLSSSDILTVDEAIDPEQEKAMAADAIRTEMATDVANKIDGVVPFNMGDEYAVMFDDGTQHTAKVIADNGDGSVQVQIDNEPQATVATKEQVQQMVDAANKARVAEAKQAKMAEQQQAEVQAEEQAIEEAQPKYQKNDTVTIRLEDGSEVRGSITEDADAEGRYEVHTEQPINGENLSYFTAEQLDGNVVKHNDTTIELPTPEPVTALSQIPTNENGEQVFEQAPASLTYEALVEMNEGDAAEALDTAQQMLAIAKKELQAEGKAAPKVGGSVMEIQKAKAEKKERLKPLQERVAYWESVVGYPATKKAEEAKKAEQKPIEEAQPVVEQEVAEVVKPIVEITPEESAKIMQKVEKRKAMAKAQSALKQKGRYAKEDAELGDYLDFADYVMRAIATGSVRFRWSNKPDSATRGLGAHLGASASNEERKSRIWMLSNENGLYPEEAAEQLLTSYTEHLGYEPNIDTMTALSEIISVVSAYPTSKIMMEGAQARHAKDSQQTEDDYYENEYVKRAAEENGMTVDEWMAFIEEYIAQYDDIKAIFAEGYLEYDQLIQNRNEQSTRVQGVQQAVSANERSTTNDNRGSEVLPTEQSDTDGGVQQGETERSSDEAVSIQSDASVSDSEAQGAAVDDNYRFRTAEKTEADYIGRALTSEEAKDVIATMQQNAQQVELMELTPENWVRQFGESGILATPIGDVKMGENQYFKLAQKGRDGKLGMIKPTLQTPDVIVEEKSSAKAGQKAERDSSYVFVKAFTNDDGTRNYLFTSVTISKEGREVVISNQEKETPRIERLLKEGKLAYISKATLPSESTNSTQGNQSTILGGAILSESKDNTSQNEKQEIGQKNAAESDNYRFKSVYHGSGADFEKFDHSFMGTGEGHQAFGWGTYVTEVEGIGKEYARMTSKPQLTFKGEFVNVEGFYNPWRIVADLYKDNQGKLREMRAKAERYSSLVEEDNPKLKALWEDVKQVLATVRSGDLNMKPARHLYSVEIPEDNGGNYLYWEEVVSDKAIDNLQDKLNEAYGEDVAAKANLKYGQDGEHLYKKLERVIGDKAASEFLNEIGYVGISYPADNGKAKGARNYVIFNEADLDVTDNIRFRSAESAPTFYSNAEYAVKAVKQEKATPEQWLKMIEKNGGLKAGEDKWLGLSDWLKASDKKTLTKQEVLDFIKENQIQIEEVVYVENPQGFEELKREYDGWLRNEGYDYAWEQLTDRYGDDAEIAFADFGGELQIDNAEAAATLLGDERSINSTRLDYTTEGLENNKEIALVVPTIESWNESDDIHFGDAGDGRAIAWVRFGETTVPVTKVKEVKAFNEPRKSEMTGRDVYTPIGTKNSKDYVVYGKMQTGEMAYVVFIGENPVSKHNTLEEARLAMNEYYKEHKHYIPAGQERVLVIDEVQSKRHQEGREKGYRDRELEKNIALTKERLAEANKALGNYKNGLKEKYDFKNIKGSFFERHRVFYDSLSAEEQAQLDALAEARNNAESEYDSLQLKATGIPSAPFEKNWAELAMKRMLRYAAENGFDKVAWTTGEQQAERYDLRQVVEQIISADNNIEETSDGIPIVKDVALIMSRGVDYNFKVDKDGVIHNTEFRGKTLSSVVGKPLAERIMQQKELVVRGADLKIGGEGMKAFYDQMLPSFMNKYGKKWGVKVGEVTMPSLEENNTMHSIDVTDAMRESVMQGQPMFRAAKADFNAQFKDLQSEYKALDKNDEGALNEWRNKKRDVVEGYLNHIKNRFGMRSELGVFNGADEAQMQDAYNKLVGAYAAKGYTNPPKYEAFKEHSMKPSVVATYRKKGDIITFNVSSEDSRNRKIEFASTLFHENAHRIAHSLYNEQELAQIWEEAKDANHHITKEVESAYKQKSDARKGNEFIGKSIGYLVAEYNPMFLDFVRGRNDVSAQDLIKKLNYKNRTGNFVVEEILNVIKDEYQNQFTRRDDSSSLGGVRDGRGSRDVGGVSQSNERDERRGRTVSERQRARVLAATTLAESLGTKVTIIESLDEITDANERTLRAKRGSKAWYDIRTGEVVIVIPNATSVEDVQRSVFHEVVAHKGLRDVIGRERFDQFLEKVFRNTDADTRSKITALAAKNGWDFRVATEEYMADLAEEGFDARENRTFWQKVRDLFMDMLREAKIALGYNINDNDLRYMLWRTYQMQKSKGVMAAAEDVLMQQKLGVGNFRTRPVGEAERVNARFNEQLEKLDEDTKDKIVLSLGYPSEILLGAGVKNKQMKLYGAKVLAKMKKHGFDVSELKDLPRAVANPIAVFNNYETDVNRSILTELTTKDGNFLVSVKIGEGEDVEFNIITSVFGKGDSKIANWINKGFGVYFNKEKTLNYLHHSAPIAEALSNSELSSITKIVENFVNPTIEGEKNESLPKVFFRSTGKAQPAEQTKEDLQKAIDKLQKNVSKLRQTIKNAKEFRKALAHLVAARVMTEVTDDIINVMGKSEFNGLVRQIREANARQDAEKPLERIEEIITDLKMKGSKQSIDRSLSLKVQGETKSGVSIAKSVDDTTRQIITFLKNNISKPKDKINDLLDGKYELFPSLVIKDIAEHYRNANDADYDIEAINQEIKELKEENTRIRYQRAELNKQNRTKEADELGNILKQNLESIAALETERLSKKVQAEKEYEYVNKALSELLEQGKGAYKTFLFENLRNKAEMIATAIEDVDTGQTLSVLTKKPTKAEKAKKMVVDLLLSPANSLNYLLKRITVNAPNGEGNMYDYFIRGNNGYIAAAEKAYEGYNEFKEELDSKAKDIFGKPYKKAIADSNELSNVVITVKAGKRQQDIPLTYGQAMYLYMVNKMADGKVKLNKMGIFDEQIELIKQNIPAEYLTFADWLQREFLPKKREKYNDTHLRIFGTQMTAIENYVPMKIKRDETYQEVDGSKQKGTRLPSSITGSIINRKRNNVILDLTTNALDLMLSHGQEMETWNAYSAVVRDMNALLTDTTFRNILNNRSDGLHKDLEAAANIAAEQYDAKTDRLSNAILFLSKGVVASKIAFRIWTAMKQVLSLPAFMAYSTSPKYQGLLVKSVANPYGAWKWGMENLPLMHKRWAGRSTGNEKLAYISESTFGKILDGTAKFGMMPNAFVDAVTCAVGAKAVYDYKIEEYRKRGFSDIEADRRAKMDATLAFNESQQSGEGLFLAQVQANRDVTSVALSTFQNSNFGYLRKMLEGAKELTRKRSNEEAYLYKKYLSQGLSEPIAEATAKKDVARAKRTAYLTFAMYGFILNILWTAGSNTFKYFFSDDDDEMKEDMIKALAIAPIRNTAIGSMAESAVQGYDVNPSLLVGEINRLKNIIEQGEAKKWDNSIGYAALKIAASMGTGVDIETLLRLYEGIEGILSDGSLDIEDVMAIANAPRSQALIEARKPKKGESVQEYQERISKIERRIDDRVTDALRKTWINNYYMYNIAEQFGLSAVRDDFGRVSIPEYNTLKDEAKETKARKSEYKKRGIPASDLAMFKETPEYKRMEYNQKVSSALTMLKTDLTAEERESKEAELYANMKSLLDELKE